MPFLKTRTVKNLGAILIVEDNIFMAELLAEKVSNAGYEAVSVYDGKGALERIGKEKFSLIILDLPLRGEINGFDLLAEIRKFHDKINLPIATLFNLSDPEAINKALKLGANFYLIKAFTNTDEIVEKVGEILRSKNREIPMEKVSEVPQEKVPVQELATEKKAKDEPKSKQLMSFEAPKRLKEKIDKILTLPESEISIIALVDSMMEYSFLARASDIHLEPFEDKLVARLRVDGILHDVFNFPHGIHSGVVTRIKVL